MARLSFTGMTRLHWLVVVALALAGLVAATNSAEWRRAPARETSTAPPPAASLPAPPVDDRPQQALALAQHLAQHPNDRDARFRLAHLYFQLQDYGRSMAELRVLARSHPKDAEVFLRQAVVLKYDGKPAEAEKAVRQALALNPDYELAREWLGEVCLDQARLRDALEAFNQSLRKNPRSMFALLGKGRALEQLSRAHHPVTVDAILAPVQKAVEMDPNNPEALATLARMKFAYLQGEEAMQEAERLALRARDLDPQNAQPSITLAQIYLSRPPTAENLGKVGACAARAGSLDLRDPRPPYFIGRVSLLQNDMDRAIKALERSIALRPMPEAVTQLAVAYRRVGDGEKADRYAQIYQRYTDLVARRDALLAVREREPRAVRHNYALVALYLEAGQPETAEQWLKEAKKLRPRDPRGDALMARVRELREKKGNGPLLAIP